MELIDQVNGAYEVLVRVTLLAREAADQVLLQDLAIQTTTMLNSKTQPQLRLGENTVYVDTAQQLDSIVFWPDLQAQAYQPYVVEEHNISTRNTHPGYQGVMFAANAAEEAYVVYRIDAPRDIARVIYGGRFYNRARNAQIRLLHSFDNGQTWTEAYRLQDTNRPWDVVHYETIDADGAGSRSVLMKYALQGARGRARRLQHLQRAHGSESSARRDAIATSGGDLCLG